MNNRIANFKVVCLLELSQSATSRLFPEVVFKNEKLYSESAKCYGLDLSKAVSNKEGCIAFFEIKKKSLDQLAVNEMNL